MFWAVTEAACATALIMIGGTDALGAIQALSLALGLREREREIHVAFLITKIMS